MRLGNWTFAQMNLWNYEQWRWMSKAHNWLSFQRDPSDGFIITIFGFTLFFVRGVK